MIRKHKNILAIISVLVFGFAVFVFIKNDLWRPQQNEQFVATTTSTNVIKTEKATTTNLSLKTYRNEEWGFEFKYPNDLTLTEHVFGNYYSQYNLVLFKSIGESRDWAVMINIVLPKFVDNEFWKSQDDISKVIVDGIEGVRYNYVFQEFPHTDVILPLGDMKMIIGTGEGSYIYLEELNQILSSFRFIK